MNKDKSIRVDYETYRKIKREAFEKDICMKEVIRRKFNGKSAS
jgi:hypothetical protein